MSKIKNCSFCAHDTITLVASYEDLRNATPEELLEAVIWFIRQSDSAPCDLEQALVASLRQGFQLAQPDGWQRVAPMWLRESREASKDE